MKRNRQVGIDTPRARLIAAWIGCAVMFICACDSKHDNAAANTGSGAGAAGPLRVFVSILPQADFVKRIAGSRVEVEVMVGPGQSHHTYEPTPRQINRLAEAGAYFQIGLPFERAVCERIAKIAPSIRLIDTTAGVSFREMTGCCATHDEYASDGAKQAATATGHTHAGRDPHIWLSPRRVTSQARNIRDALVRIDPAGASEYDAGLTRFERELSELDGRVRDRLKPYAGRAFLVFHPAYGYFADEYGLEQVAVEEDGKEPSARRLVELVARARALGLKRVFVQPQFAVGGAKAVAEAIGAKIVALDPMTVDYVRDLWTLTERVAEGFEAQGDSPVAAAKD